MEKKVKKKWSKPVINTTLKISETLGIDGAGIDGGPDGTRQHS